MAGVRFSYLFAPELYERLLWFTTLRWMAVAGLAAASLVGPAVGLPHVWPALLLVAVFVAVCNLFFTLSLRRREREDYPYKNLRACAILQILLDLAALLVVVHFTGGLQSPLLCFFSLHMAMGTIMLSTRVMYLIAGGTAAGLAGMYALEASGVLAYHPRHIELCGETIAEKSRRGLAWQILQVLRATSEHGKPVHLGSRALARKLDPQPEQNTVPQLRRTTASGAPFLPKISPEK